MTLGQKLRQIRIERGLTQKQLVGDHITRNMLSKIENDSATPSVRTLEYLAGRLGVSPGYFMNDLTYSDGTSPDGLDEMRAAYRQGHFAECISLLDASKTQSTTDEGYLLQTLANIGLAREELAEGNISAAKEHADAADYYNRQGLYYSVAIDAEMSLILSECALLVDISEFDENLSEFERAEKGIDFSERYDLARAEFLLRSGETELAEKILSSMKPVSEQFKSRRLYADGLLAFGKGELDEAKRLLLEAENTAPNEYLPLIYSALERCFKELEDYKQAYFYASKQLRK